MSLGAPVDNKEIATKVELRSWLLDRYHWTHVDVLDTCSGAGHVWSAMRDVVDVGTWVRCDVKPRTSATLKMSAAQAIRTFDLSTFNVIDIDPYGEPWQDYVSLLSRLTTRTAVFLTRGRMGMMQTSHEIIEHLGIPRSWGPDIPRSAFWTDFVAQCVLESTWRHATIEHAAHVQLPGVTYYALGLLPAGKPATKRRKEIAWLRTRTSPGRITRRIIGWAASKSATAVSTATLRR